MTRNLMRRAIHGAQGGTPTGLFNFIVRPQETPSFRSGRNAAFHSIIGNV